MFLYVICVYFLFFYFFFFFFFFFFNDTATTEIYTLFLHDALPISSMERHGSVSAFRPSSRRRSRAGARSEEHTSELQSQSNLVCRLLLEKKKRKEVGLARAVAADEDVAPIQRQVDGLFFFNDTATTEIYTLSLHDALPIRAGREQE